MGLGAATTTPRSAAPLPAGDNPPPPPTSEGKEPSPADNTRPESAEPHSDTPRSETGNADYDRAFSEAMQQASETPTGELSAQEQIFNQLGDQIRQSTAGLTSSVALESGRSGGEAASQHVQTKFADAQTQQQAESAFQARGAEANVRFQDLMAGGEAAKRSAAESRQTQDSSQRTDVSRTGTEKGGQADKSADKSSIEAKKFQLQGELKAALKKPNVDQQFAALKEKTPIASSREGAVKTYLAAKEQKAQLMQLKQRVAQELAGKENEKLRAQMNAAIDEQLAKLEPELENVPPECAEAEKGEETEDKKKAAEGEEGKESTSGSDLDAAQKIEGEGQSDADTGQGSMGGGDTNLQGTGDAHLATLTPMAAKTMTEAREKGDFGGHISGDLSADADLSVQNRMLVSIAGGRSPVHLGQPDSQGRCHLYRVTTPSERRQHPLEDIPLRRGEDGDSKGDQIKINQSGILPTMSFQITDQNGQNGRLWNEFQLQKEAENFLRAHPDATHIVLGDRRVEVEDVTPGQAKEMGIPTAMTTRISRKDYERALEASHISGVIRRRGFTPGQESLRMGNYQAGMMA